MIFSFGLSGFEVYDLQTFNKRKVFYSRYKILASLSATDKDDFTGINNKRPDFFLRPEKRSNQSAQNNLPSKVSS